MIDFGVNLGLSIINGKVLIQYASERGQGRQLTLPPTEEALERAVLDVPKPDTFLANYLL